jgi:uncharacterized protein involved in response to NO
MMKDVLSYTFRPFFLLAAVSAVVLLGYWMLLLNGLTPPRAGFNALNWHGHEMIVGFALAVVAGFVLSAVATWTGRPPVNGLAVAWLVVTWLSGRLAMFAAGNMPDTVVGALDMLFPLTLCYFVAREIFGARNKRNYKIVAILFVFAAGNLGYHIVDSGVAIYFLIHIVLLLVALIGGRIVPSFTANWLRGQGILTLPSNNLVIDRIAIALTVLVGVVVVFYPERSLLAFLAMAAAAMHAVRVMQWCGLQTVRNPLLLILHVAYWWLPVGYAMLGLASLGLVFTPATALHALTMGAIGSMVLAMITRVPLGHTGRPLHASRVTVVAYVVLTLAVIARILSPWAEAGYLSMVNIAAIGWCLAFAIFIQVYWPVLTGPPASS